MKFYNNTTQEVLTELQTTSNGLSSQEAKERLERDGKNKLAEAKKVTLLRRFINQLLDPMLIVLIIAAIISFVIGGLEGKLEPDAFIILAVVLLNAVLGVVQESKAEAALEALKKMTAATSKVLRDGQIVQVKSEDLVKGDIVILEAGDSVPADCRIIECASIKCEEAALTGESVPVEKQVAVIEEGEKEVPLGDRKNMLYMGSTVVYGRGAAVVCATGMDTEMGKIAGVLSAAENEETPLQVKLGQLSRFLTYAVIGICVVIFGVQLLRAGEFTLDIMLHSFIIAVSLAVAAIPEGLATVVTIVLSIGVSKMAKHNAVIRKLSAVETLGCTQIICSDKTGTLTQNKMTVVDQYSPDEGLLARAMALASDAELNAENQAVGEPTECALVNYAFKCGFPKGELKAEYPRVNELPFDSDRKLMSTVHNCGGKLIQYTKGAPDELLRRCKFVLLADGKVEPMTEAHVATILGENKRMADKALRVLAAAYREYDVLPETVNSETLENELVFIGLTGMIDPVRPEVYDAIKLCRTAGIRPIMITGDHKDTAIAIAMELGIISDVSGALSGTEINEMGEEELIKNIDKYSVYARVQPEHKVMIVKAWKAKGNIVAMTGDGVNDAPSIKSADIGVGMGITGTDVTKNVADMILGDDNFATIVDAVEEGRRIYDNIRKAIQFLLSSNLSEVVSVFTATMLGFTILKPVHLLWINLITDCLPALALGMEPAEADIMNRKPRDKKEGIFAGGLAVSVILEGLMISILTLVAYFLGEYAEATHTTAMTFMEFIKSGSWAVTNQEVNMGMTMAFLTMSFAETFHAYNMRSQYKSIFAIRSFNKWMIGAMAVSIILTVGVIEIPFIAPLFSFAPLDLEHFAIAAGLGLLTIPIVEIMKLIKRLCMKNK
ncbi:MAG: calcium-translocating P-type ATPase, PMCA-type [Clostridia bacterium]|nr:calcium-translocating P-type ATPase, PMCA-type [Clostridia bacterium]